MRRWSLLPRSLRFKVTTGVIVILVVALGTVFALQYRWIRSEMIARLGLSSTPLSDVIKGSLHHAMLTRDLSELEAIVDNVSRQPGVIKVVVLDKRGTVRVSPVRAEVGTRIPMSDETCQACHRVRPDARSRTMVVTAASGERIFRNVTPIVNEPACHRCHGSRDRLNGVLISDFSMADVDRELGAVSRKLLLALVLAVGATALTLTLIMNRLVIGKLERFVDAARMLGRGKLDLRVPMDAGDEIGQLATSFNEMVDGLRRAKDLRQRTDLLENVLDNVQDAVVVFDPAGSVIAFNRGAEQAFGQRAHDVVGKAPALFGDRHPHVLREARERGTFAGELPLPRADGTFFPALVRIARLESERGDAVAAVAVIRDLTEEKVKERLQEQLVHTEKLAAVGRLAAGVAHEMNNPLGNVLLYAKLLLEDLPASDTRADSARRVVDNTLRCRAIVRNLLDYARRSDVRMVSADPNEIVERSVESVADELVRRGIRCELALAPALPKVRCDAPQIQQVLVNLLQNGIEAIENGSGTLRVSTALNERGDAITVGVRDSGCGVPGDSVSRIFEPFYTTKPSGTGLGLSICYGIVERHRGRIRVETRCDGPERGSEFVVELPLTHDAMSPAAVAEHA